ncbi:MAG: tail fiber domain-containing protein [Saprospiraceae bacterium]|nr:tail fiber domain-containing protein [Saprospiraceae bacterium]
MKKIWQYLFCFSLLLFYSNIISAQSSELETDELIIKSSTPTFINAHYGLNAMTLQNYFDYARLEPDTLRLGDDIRFSILDGERLAINTALMIPGQFTTLDLDNLIFKTLGTGLGREEWQVGRTTDASNPPVSTFRILRFGVAIGGGATVQTGLAIRGSDMYVGIGTTTPAQKLDVDGNARFQSVGSGAFHRALNLTSDGTLTTSTSDLRLKENIKNLENPLEKVLALRGVAFNWKNDEEAGRRIGVIAQEVEKIMPELVFSNPVDGYLGVRYQELTALLIEAIKQQQRLIKDQEKKIGELEKVQARLDQIERRLGLTCLTN